MRRLSLWPFAWGLGLAGGVVLAAALGPHGPSWGTALAFASVSFLFSIGAWKESSPGHAGEEITHLLRITVGLTAGFLLVTVPLTLGRLAEMVDAAAPPHVSATLGEVASLRVRLLTRWALIALAMIGGMATLLIRSGRARRARPMPEPEP